MRALTEKIVEGLPETGRNALSAERIPESSRSFGSLEYPQFLTHEMSRMPDSIGRDAFSEVK